MSTRAAILLTGASGVVGRALLRQLTGRPVICLIRNGDIPAPGVQILRADLTRPRLGLSTKDHRELSRRIGAIVHSAALTEWGRPDTEYEHVNVAGTRRVIELASAAVVPVHFIGTAFVAALDSPIPLRDGNVTANYVRSKQRAESLLAMSDIPCSTYRVTNLIGDSATGWTVRPQIVQLLSNWLGRGHAPMFPAHPGNLVDIVPQDVLAVAVAGALDHGETGGDYWVTNGDAALTVRATLDIIRRHARTHGREISRPPVVHPDRITAADLAALPVTSRRYLRVLMDVSEVTARAGGRLPSSMPLLRERFGVPAVPPDVAYWRTLRAADEMSGKVA